MILENFIHTHHILGLFIIFAGMLITNIFPIMFFILPDIFIFLGIFLVKNGIVWFVPYISIVVGASIGEFINFYLGYKYSEKVLKSSIMRKNLSQSLIKKFEKNPIKTLIIGKLIPGIIWISPIIAGIIKMKPLKFFVINSLMVCIAIGITFIIWLLGINIGEKIFGEKIWIILAILVLILFVYHIIKYLKKN